MKTSVKHIIIKHREFGTPTKIGIRTEEGDLKSQLLFTIAKNDQLLEFPMELFREIDAANVAQGGHYSKLLAALVSTSVASPHVKFRP